MTPTRDSVRALLLLWMAGGCDERHVHQEAEARYGDLEDQSTDDHARPESILAEVLSQLEILNFQLIVKEDIPAILSFLSTPPGQESVAWQAWESYWEGIDMDARRAALSGNEYYLV